MKTLDSNIIKLKKILFRADFNVPVVNGIITEKSRIEAVKPTIKKLIEQKNKIFILSHFGRPKGERNNKQSLKFICKTLQESFNLSKIFFLEDFDNKKIQLTINQMNYGDVCLFENIRFYSEEEKNNLNFVKKITQNFEFFVNDAFSASHRNHASIVGIPKILPSFAGYAFINEIKNINKFIRNPKKPNLAIIGGSKVSSKIDLLNNLCKYYDKIVIAGAMANTFLYAKKVQIGKSLCEKELSQTALSILKRAENYNCEIILPVDVNCADNLSDKINIRQCDVDNIFQNQIIFDIGIKTTKIISSYILKSNMILWNGPLGAFEYQPFEKSSVEIASIIKKNAKLLNISVIAGGGDTVSLIKLAKAEDGFSYISNAGGAFLDWLEGKESFGVKALKQNNID